ncbi:MAG: hypothetical protein JO107_03100 [Hyphomicrobiales bacterium]|nr:hypothetical protein [Hyphomicrobiales bacterium]MBV8662069.1 hypothetical protein [Hyphomicrobiales bacterium]
MRIESPVPFAASRLWAWQRAYFEARGLDAWRLGEVPHYVAANPTVAHAFADLLLGLALDERRLRGDDRDPIVICELGAGSGRFAFHLLTRLEVLCARANLALTEFRYVLTDITPATRAFWRAHPKFARHFESGVLDTAEFDVTAPGSLALDRAGAKIAPGELGAPLVVVANYLFDSVPQDLFAFENGESRPCRLALDLDEGASEPREPGDWLANIRLTYEIGEPGSPYPEPWLETIVQRHAQEIARSHVLMPAPALRCLEALRALSRRGLMLLSVDMGRHTPAALDGRGPPRPNRHGSISLEVNYYAIRLWCENAGGLALAPSQPHRSIAAACCLLVDQPQAYRETQAAFARSIEEVGPDAFFTISRHARKRVEEMSLEEILAYLSLSHFDAHLFAAWLPRLSELAPEFDADERAAVIEAVERVWDGYFPIGESSDLAAGLAALLYQLDAFAPALRLFAISAAIYGDHTGKRFNRAACLAELGQDEQALTLLDSVLAHDPDNAAAAALRASLVAVV